MFRDYAIVAAIFLAALGFQEWRVYSAKNDAKLASNRAALFEAKVALQNTAIDTLKAYSDARQAEAKTAAEIAARKVAEAESKVKQLRFKSKTCEGAAAEAKSAAKTITKEW